MSKIKISLANGNQVEKPLVTAFKGTSGDYLILDNNLIQDSGKLKLK